MFFSDLSHLKAYLLKTRYAPSNSLCGKYYIYFVCDDKDNIALRINEVFNGLFGTTLLGYQKQVAGIDIHIKPTYVYITNLMINDTDYAKTHNYSYMTPLNDTDCTIINDLLMDYAKYITHCNNLNKIRHDVHNNLEQYKKYMKPYNFILTLDKAEDNPFWLQTYKTL